MLEETWRKAAPAGVRREQVLLIALLALTAIRLIVAGLTPLAPDEAYYWVWSRALAAGYPDHPPMVALWIRFGTAIAGPTPLGVRLLGPLSAALGSVLLVDATNRLLPRRSVGWIAAALLNASLLFGVGAVIMTPDTPLLFFWTASVWAIARVIASDDGRWWLMAGAFTGLALVSKYTAVLLPAGYALLLLTVPNQRRWLKRVEPWIGLALAAIIFLPVMVWNLNHGWVSFAHQGERIADWQPDHAAQYVVELIGGQFLLATPLVFIVFLAGAGFTARQAWRTRDAAWTLLALLLFPGALLFLEHSLGDRVQGNWPAVLYPAAAISAAALAGKRWSRLHGWAILTGLTITAAVYVHAVTGLIPVPARLDPVERQLGRWDELPSGASEAAASERLTNFVADQYGVASELAWMLPSGLRVVAVDPRWAMFNLPRAPAASPSLLVWPAERTEPPDPALWPGVRAVRVPGVEAAGAPFQFYRIDGLPRDFPAVMLPRP